VFLSSYMACTCKRSSACWCDEVTLLCACCDSHLSIQSLFTVCHMLVRSLDAICSSLDGEAISMCLTRSVDHLPFSIWFQQISVCSCINLANCGLVAVSGMDVLVVRECVSAQVRIFRSCICVGSCNVMLTVCASWWFHLADIDSHVRKCD
jgi:hypothetical protein